MPRFRPSEQGMYQTCFPLQTLTAVTKLWVEAYRCSAIPLNATVNLQLLHLVT